METPTSRPDTSGRDLVRSLHAEVLLTRPSRADSPIRDVKIRKRCLTKRLRYNPHPDPDDTSPVLPSRSTTGQIECRHEIASGQFHTASLNAGEPVEPS
ncbi:MAG: hypothetical protein LC775_16940 [Acidobacteria bacterium]|nr:hypothetical protein [Acidobacteriota bacterium]